MKGVSFKTLFLMGGVSLGILGGLAFEAEALTLQEMNQVNAMFAGLIAPGAVSDQVIQKYLARLRRDAPSSQQIQQLEEIVRQRQAAAEAAAGVGDGSGGGGGSQVLSEEQELARAIAVSDLERLRRDALSSQQIERQRQAAEAAAGGGDGSGGGGGSQVLSEEQELARAIAASLQEAEAAAEAENQNEIAASLQEAEAEAENQNITEAILITDGSTPPLAQWGYLIGRYDNNPDSDGISGLPVARSIDSSN